MVHEEKPISAERAQEIFEILHRISIELHLPAGINKGEASLACYRGTTSLESIRDHISAIEGACRNLSDPQASNDYAIRRLRNANRQISILIDRVSKDFTVLATLIAVAVDLEYTAITTPQFLESLRKKKVRYDPKKKR
jgi:hypothetical protein